MNTSLQTPFIVLTHGSKLYGTDTPTSDTDIKVVYLPALDDMLLGRYKRSYKERFDADGKPLVSIGSAGLEVEDHNTPMPDNGTETEFFNIQTFVRDFVQGQTWALEVAHGVACKAQVSSVLKDSDLFCEELIEKFGNRDVYSMTSFAQKQTLDYVHRGERMATTKKVLDLFMKIAAITGPKERLNAQWSETETMLEFISRETGFPIGQLENNNKVFKALDVNGRMYMDTTEIAYMITLFEGQMRTYGKRTTETFGKPVEWKSMSHAIRVYQQAIELLDTGKMTFPRPNNEYLLAVKQGRIDFAIVKEHLAQLDAEILLKQAASTMREKTPELVAAADQWMLEKLRSLYSFNLIEDVEYRT